MKSVSLAYACLGTIHSIQTLVLFNLLVLLRKITKQQQKNIFCRKCWLFSVLPFHGVLLFTIGSLCGGCTRVCVCASVIYWSVECHVFKIAVPISCWNNFYKERLLLQQEEHGRHDLLLFIVPGPCLCTMGWVLRIGMPLCKWHWMSLLSLNNFCIGRLNLICYWYGLQSGY